MEYPHILDQKSEPKEDKLVFTKNISERTGDLRTASFQPKDFKHVRHLVGNLYFAWDSDPLSGCVYLAEYK